MSKFCSNCGNSTEGSDKFCIHCGSVLQSAQAHPQQASTQYQQTTYPPQYQSYPTYQQVQYQPDVVRVVSEKIKIDGVIWTVVAAIQYIIGLSTIITGYGIAVLIVAIINTFVAVGDFKYSKEILMRPVGIVDKYEPIGNLIANLIYNILFGGLIGVAGTIYGFVLRNYVITNQQQLMAIQMEFVNSNTYMK